MRFVSIYYNFIAAMINDDYMRGFGRSYSISIHGLCIVNIFNIIAQTPEEFDASA